MKQLFARLLASLLVIVAMGGLFMTPALAQTTNQQPLQANDFALLRLPLLRSTTDQSFFTYLSNIISFLLLVAGVVAFFYVLYGGFLYLTSGGDQTGAQKGRTMIANALIGIVIIFLSYALVRFFVSRLSSEGNNGPTNTFSNTGG